MNRPAFLLEDHLGKLAKWLRFLGYDAAIYPHTSFASQAKRAVKERRILLTRSEKHAHSDWKFSRKLIHSDDPREQLTELSDMLELNESMIGSRCMQCNRPLFHIEKEKARSMVPEYVYQTQDEFSVCRKCGRVYWRGTHWQKMLKWLRDLL